jgi:hypothetical protein
MLSLSAKFRFFVCSLMLVTTLVACAAGGSSVTPTPITPARPAPPSLGSFDPATVADLNLGDYPILPEIGAQARAIYQAGIAAGNNPHVFSKLGDCMTENPNFLEPFSAGQYELGEYAHLQAVIDQFAGIPARTAQGWTADSFTTVGFAAASGFNIAGPLDPIWANPQWCEAGESPLACEYRVAKPSIAIIMFGTNDVTYTDADTYNYYLRTLVGLTLDHQVLPLLNTFPTRPEDPEKSLLLNRIVIKVASDYGVPLVNLNRALEPLPHQGVDPADTIHLNVPPDARTDVFTAESLQDGFPMRNLVTLQALEVVLEAVK